MKIAIYGGSFDPFHIAHEKIVNEALKTLDLDLLILVPTYLNPHKISYHLEPDERLFLLQKNFAGEDRILVSEYEVSKNRSVYTIETIKFFKDFYKPKKTYLIIGADNFETFHTWYKSDEILKEVELAVATRKGYLNQNYASIAKLYVDIDISSTELRKNLNLDYVPIKIKEYVKKLWQ